MAFSEDNGLQGVFYGRTACTITVKEKKDRLRHTLILHVVLSADRKLDWGGAYIFNTWSNPLRTRD